MMGTSAFISQSSRMHNSVGDELLKEDTRLDLDLTGWKNT